MSDETRRRPQVHDVLLIPATKIGQETLPNGRTKMLRFEVDQDGTYRKPAEAVDFGEKGARKLYSIARPSQPEQVAREVSVDPKQEPERGPVLAVLPLREDPGTEYGTCYLVNAENLETSNVWTEDDLESTGTDEPDEILQRDADFELLLAAPRGNVFHVRRASGRGDRIECKQVDLRHEAEIWSQLREGTVIGTVLWKEHPDGDGAGRVLPLVNVTSLKLPKRGRP